MKKTLVFAALGLFLVSCTQQNRNDEYICNSISKGKFKDINLEIYKDTVKYQRTGNTQYTFDILDEKNDRILFGYEALKDGQSKKVFYKKTKIFKWDSSYKKTSDDFSVVYKCQKLN